MLGGMLRLCQAKTGDEGRKQEREKMKGRRKLSFAELGTAPWEIKFQIRRQTRDWRGQLMGLQRLEIVLRSWNQIQRI